VREEKGARGKESVEDPESNWEFTIMESLWQFRAYWWRVSGVEVNVMSAHYLELLAYCPFLSRKH